jgi:hypothetical protein
MLADHIYHDVRLIGEASPEAEFIDEDFFVTIGGDRAGTDPTYEEYIEGRPG